MNKDNEKQQNIETIKRNIEIAKYEQKHWAHNPDQADRFKQWENNLRIELDNCGR